MPQPTARFQFTLKTTFVVFTGLSVVLAFSFWLSGLGILMAVPLVGIWWLYGAMVGGHRRLAYVLLAATLGSVVHAATVLPVTYWLGDFLPRRAERLPDWYIPATLLAMCLATTATALILRRLIRRASIWSVAFIALAANYLTAAFYAPVFVLLLPFAFPGFGGPGSGIAPTLGTGGTVVDHITFTFFVAVVAGTAWVPLTVPIGAILCGVLRWVDPPMSKSEAAAKLVAETRAAAGLPTEPPLVSSD